LTKLSLSKGGGGWRKTFKNFPIKFSVLVEKLDLYFYLTSKNILRAFQKKFHYESKPEPKKSQIMFLHIFSTRCASGESHEMEFAKDADMKPPRDCYIPLEEHCLN
jgi:hypothetical protein